MKDESNPKRSRRKFLSWGLIGGAGLVAQPVKAMVPDTTDEETISMLTPDGKLVQVPKQILDQSGDRKKARNEDILNWSETQNKTKP